MTINVWQLLKITANNDMCSKVKLIDYAFQIDYVKVNFYFYLFVCFVARTLVFLPNKQYGDYNSMLGQESYLWKLFGYIAYNKKIYVLEFKYKILHLMEDSVYQLEVIAYVS